MGGRPVPQQNRLPPRNNPPPSNNQGFGQTQLGVPQSQVQGFRNTPPQQPLNNQNQIQSAPSKPSCTPGLLSKQLKNCPGACPNHEWEGNQYIITWLVDDNRCSNFTGHEAEDYCQLQGGHAVSLDTTPKALHFIDVLFNMPDVISGLAEELITTLALLHGHLETERDTLEDKDFGPILEVKSPILNLNQTTEMVTNFVLECLTTFMLTE